MKVLLVTPLLVLLHVFSSQAAGECVDTRDDCNPGFGDCGHMSPQRDMCKKSCNLCPEAEAAAAPETTTSDFVTESTTTMEKGAEESVAPDEPEAEVPVAPDAPKFVALGAPCTMRVWAQCNADINSQCRKKKMADGTKGKVCACRGKFEVIEDKCVQKCDAGKKRVEGKCVAKA